MAQEKSAKPTEGSVPVDANALIAAMTDIVIVVDREGRCVWIAPTLATIYPEDRRRMSLLLGRKIHEMIEDTAVADQLIAVVHAALDTGETQRIEYPVHIFDESVWLAAAVSPMDNDRVVWVARNVTDRVLARQALEERVEERTRDLESVLEISGTVASALDVRQVLGLLLRQARAVIPYNGASVNLLEGNDLVVLDAIAPTEDYRLGARFPVDFESPIWKEMSAGRSMIIVDTLDENDLFAAAYMTSMRQAGLADVEALKRIRSWMSVPLLRHDVIIGTLSMSRPEAGFFTEEHARLAMAVAGQAAVAIENARLFEQKEERTRELAVLLDVSRELTAARELRPLARAMLEQIKRVIDYTGGSALAIEGDTIRFIQSMGPDGIEEEQENLRLPLDPEMGLTKKVMNGEHVIIENVRGEGQMAADYREILGGSLERPAYSYIRGWMAIPLHLEGRVIGIISLSKDVPGYFTEHHVELATAIARHAAIAAENATLLEQRERRTRELSALFEISRALSSTLELQPLLEVMLDQLRALVHYEGAGISLITGDEIVQLAVRRPKKYSDMPGSGPTTTEKTFGPVWDRLSRGETITIDDVLDESLAAQMFRRSWGGDLRGTAVEYIRSVVIVPLVTRDQVLGTLNLAHSEPAHFKNEHVELVKAVASPAAAAIANARLFQETEQRTRQLLALLEVSRAVVSTLDVRELMSVILDQLQTILEHSGSAIIVREGDELVIVDARAKEGAEREVGLRFSLEASGMLWETIGEGRPVIIDDIRADEPLAKNYRQVTEALGLLELTPFDSIRSWMAVPLSIGDEVIGMLTMSRTEPGYFQAEHAALVGLFANQAALAIEHARLISQGQRLAAVEERQRLARELHDSVSQALYGIALGARTARTVLDRDPVKAIEPVEYVLSLAEAGLAEMRALIFELRPESLETEGIVAALNKQIAATSARYGIAITADLCPEPSIAIELKEVLYRIAQEALHNTVKHARATSVRIGLEHVDGRLSLTVSDDGVGFDPSVEYPGHLGLRSMRERATQAGGDLRIKSRPGSGTIVIADMLAN